MGIYLLINMIDMRKFFPGMNQLLQAHVIDFL
jgi:hypothetical protein